MTTSCMLNAKICYRVLAPQSAKGVHGFGYGAVMQDVIRDAKDASEAVKILRGECCAKSMRWSSAHPVFTAMFPLCFPRLQLFELTEHIPLLRSFSKLSFGISNLRILGRPREDYLYIFVLFWGGLGSCSCGSYGSCNICCTKAEHGGNPGHSEEIISNPIEKEGKPKEGHQCKWKWKTAQNYASENDGQLMKNEMNGNCHTKSQTNTDLTSKETIHIPSSTHKIMCEWLLSLYLGGGAPFYFNPKPLCL